jgi:hypothetical protein
VTTRLLGVLLAVGATAAGVALSNLGMVFASDEESLVRLSWRAIAERSELCRVPSEEEQASIPMHMRQAEICEGRLASFRLVVSIDGEAVVDRELRPAGAREDRPTYVLETLPIQPGPHRLEVSFQVLAESDSPPLQIAAPIHPGPGDVVLVTRDERGELIIR